MRIIFRAAKNNSSSHLQAIFVVNIDSTCQACSEKIWNICLFGVILYDIGSYKCLLIPVTLIKICISWTQWRKWNGQASQFIDEE